MERRKHPSGRPIRHGTYTRLPIRRSPPDEPLTPGLRRDESVTAIGFHTDWLVDDHDHGTDDDRLK